MEILFNKIFLQHETGPKYLENSDRLKYFSNLPNIQVTCDEDKLLLVHLKEYINWVKKCSKTEKFLESSARILFSL